MENINLSLLAATQGFAAFTVLMPPLATVRRADYTIDSETRADVRAGQIAATVMTMSIGALISGLSKSSTPLLIATVISLVTISVYEYTLRTEGTLNVEK